MLTDAEVIAAVPCSYCTADVGEPCNERLAPKHRRNERTRASPALGLAHSSRQDRARRAAWRAARDARRADQ